MTGKYYFTVHMVWHSTKIKCRSCSRIITKEISLFLSKYTLPKNCASQTFVAKYTGWNVCCSADTEDGMQSMNTSMHLYSWQNMLTGNYVVMKHFSVMQFFCFPTSQSIIQRIKWYVETGEVLPFGKRILTFTGLFIKEYKKLGNANTILAWVKHLFWWFILHTNRSYINKDTSESEILWRILDIWNTCRYQCDCCSLSVALCCLNLSPY